MTFLRCPAILQCLRTLPALALVILVSWSVLPAHAAALQNTSVIGKWNLTAVLESSEITSIDDAEAQQFVGKVLTISKDKVQLGTRVCKAPEFDVTREVQILSRRSARKRRKTRPAKSGNCRACQLHVCLYQESKPLGRALERVLFCDPVRLRNYTKH